MRVQSMRYLLYAVAVCIAGAAQGQSQAPQTPPAGAAPNAALPQVPAQAPAQTQGSVKISLDDAIQMALQHNHSLLAARTTIQQNEAEETTANLRPNPIFLGDAQFLPLFQPDQFSSDYLDTSAQFDLGISYLLERGKKRQQIIGDLRF